MKPSASSRPHPSQLDRYWSRARHIRLRHVTPSWRIPAAMHSQDQWFIIESNSWFNHVRHGNRWLYLERIDGTDATHWIGSLTLTSDRKSDCVPTRMMGVASEEWRRISGIHLFQNKIARSNLSICHNCLSMTIIINHLKSSTSHKHTTTIMNNDKSFNTRLPW